MKKVLILYWHGLGDIIQLTPHMRYLYNKGYMVDLMCRKEVKKSSLLNDCPYINELFEVKNPWQSSLGFERQFQKNIQLFNKLCLKYTWAGKAVHRGAIDNKIDFTSKELDLNIKNKSLEVFINKEIEKKALKYINKNYPNGYIFVHTYIEWHKYHNWNASIWIKENLPDLPIFNTHIKGVIDENINFSFVIAREASYRVLSSSVFVHACDAMNVVIDVINYGRPAKIAWPLNQDIVLHIREKGQWLK